MWRPLFLKRANQPARKGILFVIHRIRSKNPLNPPLKKGDFKAVRPSSRGGFRTQTRLACFLVYWPILVLPAVLGGARPFLWSFAASVFLGAFALFLLASRQSLAAIDLKPWLLILLPVLGYPVLQIIPLPLPVISVLSPQRAVWLQRSFDATGDSRWAASLSYVPLDTLAGGLWILTLVLFALVLHRSIREGIIRPRRFLPALFAVAGLEAFYGISQVLVSSTGLGPGAQCAVGTFANRSHYAAFLGMIWPLQLVWLLKVSDKDGKTWCGKKRFLRPAFAKQVFYIFLIGLVILGLIFSGSRGGIIGLALSTAVLIYLGAKSSSLISPFYAGCWVVILIYGWIIGFEGIVKHFAEIGLDAPSRLKIWQFSWNALRDHWLTGTGVGTYRSVVFAYQVFDTDLVQVGAAHNDYLQVASEWGLPFSLFIFFLVWGYWWITAIGVAKTGPAGEGAGTEEKLVRAGALAGSAAFLAHSWVEFNWQIPANQLYFTILLVLMRYKAPEQRLTRLSTNADLLSGRGLENWERPGSGRRLFFRQLHRSQPIVS